MECLRALNRGALLWRPSAPLCAVCVKAASLSQTLPRCHCFYLSLLDGALRCGTLWHKKRLIPSLSLSPQLCSQPTVHGEQPSSFPVTIFLNQTFSQLKTTLKHIPPLCSDTDFSNYITLCRPTFFFTAVGRHRLKPAISNAFNCSGN